MEQAEFKIELKQSLGPKLLSIENYIQCFEYYLKNQWEGVGQF